MGTFIVSTKYLKTKEEDMETRDSRDLGYVSGMNQKWVFKRTGLVAENIFKVVEYSAGKTLLITNDDIEILSNEAFEDVYKKWSEAYEDYDIEEDTEGINHSDEKDSEEDDN